MRHWWRHEYVTTAGNALRVLEYFKVSRQVLYKVLSPCKVTKLLAIAIISDFSRQNRWKFPKTYFLRGHYRVYLCERDVLIWKISFPIIHTHKENMFGLFSRIPLLFQFFPDTNLFALIFQAFQTLDKLDNIMLLYKCLNFHKVFHDFKRFFSMLLLFAYINTLGNYCIFLFCMNLRRGVITVLDITEHCEWSLMRKTPKLLKNDKF